MRRVSTAVAGLALCASAVYAQTPGTTPKFDAADISLRSHTGITSQGGMTGGVEYEVGPVLARQLRRAIDKPAEFRLDPILFT